MSQYRSIEEGKDLYSLLSRDDISVVITGDSLSYNRYDFDDQSRINAYDCYPGMPSWSFMLRDAIYQNDSFYIFGDSICYNGCKWSRGNAPENPDTLKYSCPNHGKVATIFIEDCADICSFTYRHSNSDTDKVILYMQKRPDQFACIFDIYVDDELILPEIDNIGDNARFQGWELFELELLIPGDGMPHEVSFRNIRKKDSVCLKNPLDTDCRITIAGVGTKRSKIYLTGCGGQTTEFFINNMEERITRYKPECLVFIIGANDYFHLTASEFEVNLDTILKMVKDENPEAEILLISPPRDKCDDHIAKLVDMGVKPFIESMYRLSEKHDCVFLDLIELFDGISTDVWRFDNIHLTKWGNTYLARNMLDRILPKMSHYNRKLVDAHIWFDN